MRDAVCKVAGTFQVPWAGNRWFAERTARGVCLLPLVVLISIASAASFCLGDERGRDEAVTVEAGAEVEVQVDAEDAPKEKAKGEQAAGEQAAEAKPPRPKPVGKLGIRKGTGRPKGMPRVEENRLAPPPAAFAEPAIADGLQAEAVDEQIEIRREQLETQSRELETQLREILPAEIYFVHLVCDTNRRERKQLMAASEAELEKVALVAARRIVAAGEPEGRGQVARVVQGNVMAFANDGASSDAKLQPVEMLREALLRLVEEQLGEERAAGLRQEMKQRLEAQRRDTIGNIIIQLDAFLILSPEQQEDLVQPLLAGWRDDWRAIPQQVQDQYIPAMQLPSAAVMMLSNAQRTRWESIPKIQFGNPQNQQLQGRNRAQQANHWEQVLDQLDRAEQESEQSQ